MRTPFLVAVGLCGIAATCTPTFSSGIAVAPAPAASADRVRNAAFTLVTRMATRFGLEPSRSGKRDVRCFSRSAVTLCARALDREAHFRIHEFARGRFSPRADTLRRELLDSLRAAFGERRVRECDWDVVSDGRLLGCSPVAPTDSS